MPQVSKRPISKELTVKVNRLLWESLAKLSEQESVGQFLNDILTPTERVMVSKRLAIALLLSRGWDQEAISDYLKVSTTTVQTLKRNLVLSGRGYMNVIKQIERDKEWLAMKLDLTQAFEEILASRVGRNWKVSKAEVFKKYRVKRREAGIL